MVIASALAPAFAAAEPSPTGRTPRVIWTPERQAVWARMKREYDAQPLAPATRGAYWYGLAKQNAECACRYSDNGIWGTLMFQITGDRKYADLAWARLQKTFFPLTGSSLGVHHAREDSIELVMMYDWLYPALSDAQRDAFLAKLNEMFLTVTAPSKWLPDNLPFRTDDSDQVTGTYFGVVLHYLVTGGYNPTAVEIYNRAIVGGLASTGLNRDTWRNAIGQFVTQLAAGGEWIESSHYNLGTVRLLMMGAEGVRTVTGVDYFPEVREFVRNHARRMVHFVTPDLDQTFQWGDEEHARDFIDRVYAWETTSAMVAGLTQDDAEVGPYVEQLVYDLADTYGTKADPWGRFYLFFNPYADRRPRSEMPTSWFASGQGILLQRTGWNPDASFFMAHMPRRQWAVDHQVYFFADFQLYRHGEWAITHPLGYDEGLKKGNAVNAMLIAGLSNTAEYKEVQAVETGLRGEYTYITGTMGGQRMDENVWDPPPTYLHEWSRSFLYLPSVDGHSDTIVIHDRVNAENPQALPKFDHYKAYDIADIKAAPSMKQWFIHAPVEPTMTADGFSWAISQNQEAHVAMLLPEHAVATPTSEAAMWPAAAMPASERGWQVRITPPVEQQWDTFLNVVQVSDAGTPVKIERVRSVARDADGALVHRPGVPDTLAIFNAMPGPNLPSAALVGDRSRWRPEVQQTLARVRLRSKGYQVAWVAGAATSDLYLADLDPSVSWGVSLDNGIEASLVPGASGVARVAVSGAGAHVITVRAAGEPVAAGSSVIVLKSCPQE